MTIYPTDGWNSFCSVADANTIMAETIDPSAWNALTEAQKEAYLKQASLLIKLRIQPPDELEEDLKTATVYLANYSIGKDMTNNSGDDNVKRLSIDGAIEKEYFTKGARSNAFPSLVTQLLAQYGLVSGASFKIARAL